MFVTPAINVLSVLFGLPLLVGGAMMIWFGARLRSRGGGEPHCRECGYLLIGITSANCPECGTPLSRGNIVHGVRRRRLSLALGGVGLLLLGGIAAIPFAASVNDSVPWYHLAPTFWVMRDLKKPATESSAMAELLRRDRNGDLSLAQQRSIADIGLQVQATPANSGIAPDLVEFAGKEMLAGRLTEQQKASFFKNSIRLTLRVRPRIRSGEPVPFDVSEAARVQGGPLWVHADMKRIEIDGKVVQEYPDSDSGGAASGLGASGGTGSSVKCNEPGDHELAVTCRTILSKGAFAKPSAEEPLFRQEIRLTAKFHVLAPGEVDEFAVKNDPALAGQLHRCIVPAKLKWSPGEWNLGGEFQTSNLPANVAFKMVVRIGGRELDARSGFSGNKGSNTTHIFAGRITGVTDPKPATVDIILRTDEKEARDSVDQFDVWKGELVYENLPVGAGK